MEESTQTSIRTAAPVPEITQLHVSQITLAENVRQVLTNVDELVESVKIFGILEPLRVKQTNSGDYVLEAGHRRLAAAKAAGLEFVPVVVSDLSDSLRRMAQLAENIHRENLSAFETADALQAEVDGGRSTEEIARLMGKGPTDAVKKKYVLRHLALLKLEPKLVAAMRRAGVGIGNAETIASTARKGSLDEALGLARQMQDKTLPRKSKDTPAETSTDGDSPLRFGKKINGRSYKLEVRLEAAPDEAKVGQIKMLVHSLELLLSGY